ncbi:4'-phosphopantetheinyl transferase superfamily protein [Hydrogenophaga sp.]|uniref:4'-phosphopantetheinyl transferase family protein n=1 Tax=Hydrogenophaga sp. TaxID=1904254 RepID=UPI002731FD76|nr:4'-phosphopantetheinyl transferase superfamily protein [Hydrogenophaga sp.]MDP2074199.1 4'-phosphopantetheinyl transferase superfamily protein [Hydrogenophaga sp.]MDP3106801.1 4'-phosphopantetheinyl transferase superfamily protein [Hydrogenophaga sp.]MDZ4400179.1 4'-phosphopantetheinyl transferase superfamily protein [Hydrogenophaga sp.]
MTVAHVWLGGPSEADTNATVLCDAERTRAASFRFERDRNSWIAAHTLLRRALSERMPEVAPSAWRFESAPGGRPELAGPFKATGLRFSLAHAPEAVACVVTQEVSCGIDVERLARAIDVEALGRRTASAAERAGLQALPAADRGAQFMRLWTLKEAYAKATGRGLATPFGSLDFDLTDGIVIRATGDGRSNDEFGFVQWTTSDGHVVAVAASTCRGRPPQVVLHTSAANASVTRVCSSP